MGIKNYTTVVAEERTVAEIQTLLSMKGARSIQIDYDDKTRPSSVSFVIVIQEVPVPFRLPCNFDGVFRAMAREYSSPRARRHFENSSESMAQARRCAWRIVKDWVAAQMALIEAEQATLAQVFLPYAVVSGPDRLTMYDQFMLSVSSQKSLSAGV